MGKHVAFLIGVVALAGVGVVLANLRETTPPVPPVPPPTAPVSSPQPAPTSVQDAPPPAVVPPAIPVEAPSEPPAQTSPANIADPVVAPPANVPPPAPPSPPAAIEPQRQVVGESPYPAGGKPVGPFDISWSFQVGVSTASGTITIRHLSPAAHVIVEVVAKNGARLAQPFRTELDMGKDETRSYPLDVLLGQGSNTLIVTATAHATDRRARVVSIPLVPAAPEPVPQTEEPTASTPNGSPLPGSASQKPVAPLSGSQVIRDDRGEVIQFDPAAPTGK